MISLTKGTHICRLLPNQKSEKLLLKEHVI